MKFDEIITALKNHNQALKDRLTFLEGEMDKIADKASGIEYIIKYKNSVSEIDDCMDYIRGIKNISKITRVLED